MGHTEEQIYCGLWEWFSLVKRGTSPISHSPHDHLTDVPEAAHVVVQAMKLKQVITYTLEEEGEWHGA